MKRFILAALAVLALGLAACSGGGDDDPTAPTEKWAWESEKFSERVGYTTVTGVLRNISDEKQHVRTVNYRAWDGNVEVAKFFYPVLGDVAPGAGVAYEVIVKTDGRKVTHWERWVEQ